jgi:hypothetical protein
VNFYVFTECVNVSPYWYCWISERHGKITSVIDVMFSIKWTVIFESQYLKINQQDGGQFSLCNICCVLESLNSIEL